MRANNSFGIISIELLILIVILSLVAITTLYAYVSARLEAFDKQRVADITAIQKALQLYHTENGFYPQTNNGQPAGITDYLNRWPVAPVSGKCNSPYFYTPKLNGSDYTLSFCLSSGLRSINSTQTP